MNVRATAGPESNAAAGESDPHITPVTEGTTSEIPDTSAGKDSESNGTDFRAKMRAQLETITVPSESDASNSGDLRIEESDLQSDERGKLAGKRLAALPGFYDRSNRLSKDAPPAAKPSRWQASHWRESSQVASVDSAARLTAESVPLVAPWIGCDPANRTMDTTSESELHATPFDSKPAVGSLQFGAPIVAAVSDQRALASQSAVDSIFAAPGVGSRMTSPAGDDNLAKSEMPEVGQPSKRTEITTQNGLAHPRLAEQAEQASNDIPPLLPSHSNGLRVNSPLVADASEAVRIIDRTTAKPENQPSTPLPPSDPITRFSASSRTDDSPSAPSSTASAQPVQRPTLAAQETKKGLKSPRSSSADEYIGASNREHAISAHNALRANDSAFLAPETSTSFAFPTRNSHEQRGQFQISEAFTALEAGTNVASGYRAVQHGARIQAEAGFQDPSLGWIGVRAETHGGALHATVLSPSTEAAQALSVHSAGLNAYLADRNTSIDSLAFVSTGDPSGQAAPRDSREGTHQGSGDRAEHDSTTQPLQQTSRTVAVGSHSVPGSGSLGIAPTRSPDSSIGARVSVLA